MIAVSRNIGTGFRNADSELFEKLVGCLDFMNGLPFFKAYKSHSWQSLKIQPNQTILDVACGTGADLIELATRNPDSRFIGIDKSEKFLAVAKERAASLPNLRFLPGDGQQLPLDDHSVDAARVDRSLQHMEEPAAALKEMARVTKKGGRLVACEPDWQTFVLFNGEYEDSRQIAGYFQRSIRNPYIGRELASLMSQCHIKILQTHIHAFWTNRLDDANIIFDLAKVKEQSAAADMISQDDAENWWTLSEQASQKGTFFAALNVVETVGTIA